MIATAVATDGSVSNVAGIVSGRMQSAFVQSDVAYWASNDARLILAAYGLSEADVKAEHLKSRQAGDKLKAGNLDAFYKRQRVTGRCYRRTRSLYPHRLNSYRCPRGESLIGYNFFSADEIRDDAYKDIASLSCHASFGADRLSMRLGGRGSFGQSG